LGVSGEQLRDVIVKELLGMYLGEGKFDGSGLVPQRLIFQVTPTAPPEGYGYKALRW
jgi:hypothetical protein